jgi:2-dehydropantoate 2-reductase
MSVAILGPGAVGGMLAVRLTIAGETTICVAREDTCAAIRAAGLTLVRAREELVAEPAASEALSYPVDLLLVTVKAPRLEEALRRVAAEPFAVIPLLNGIEHLSLLRGRFENVVAGTIGHFEGYREGPTRIVQLSRAAAVVTVASDGPAAPLIRAGIEVRTLPSERDVLWEKLARLAPLAALTAATGRSLGGLRNDPRLGTALVEACAVAEADGATATVREQWEIIEAMPDSLTTSAARDMAAGRPSELDAIVGAVVRAGRRLGVETPTLEELLASCTG